MPEALLVTSNCKTSPTSFWISRNNNCSKPSKTQQQRMPGEGSVAGGNGPEGTLLHHGASVLAEAVAAICLVWYLAVVIVCTLGYVQL